MIFADRGNWECPMSEETKNIALLLAFTMLATAIVFFGTMF